MGIDLDSILSEFASTKGEPARAFEVLKRIGRELGYDHAVATFRQSDSTKLGSFQANTYSDAWASEAKRLTLHEILQDPIVSHLMSRVDPIVWSKKNYEEAGLPTLYERFRDFGLGSGIALSVRGSAGETLSVGFCNSEQLKAPHKVPLEQLGALYLSGTAMFNRLAEHQDTRRNAPLENASGLTPREIECLRWARLGKTGWEIAKILGISQATSTFHMKNAITKLDAVNKTHAVIVAVERGLID